MQKSHCLKKVWLLALTLMAAHGYGTIAWSQKVEPNRKAAKDDRNRPRLVEQKGHTSLIVSSTFSPDDRFVLTGGGDDIAILWDKATGVEVRRFKGHSHGIFSVAFSPDGQHVLTGSIDKTARLWDVATGREIRRFEGHSSGVFSVAFSPDGKYVLTGGSNDKTARLWDVATGKEVRSFEGNSDLVWDVAFSPDNRFVLTGCWDKTARLWDVATGKEVRSFLGHSDSIFSVIFSPDGRYVLTGSFDKTARLWDVATGREIRRFKGHSETVWDVAFSPDGKYVLTGSEDKTARLWDVATGKEIRRFEGHSDNIYSVAFSPDGRNALTGSRDETARLWDVETGESVQSFKGYSDTVWGVEFSPDGRFFLTGGDDVRLWDSATGRELRRFEGDLFKFSPDGRSVLTANWRTAILRDIATGQERHRFQGHSGNIRSVAFSPDCRFIITASESPVEAEDDKDKLAKQKIVDNTVRLWEVATEKELWRFEKHSSGINSVAFSPDGQFVVTGGGDSTKTSDNTVRLLNATTGKEIRQFCGHELGVNSVAFSPDSKYILTGAEDARLWDVATGNVIQRFEHANVVFSVAFSPDGRFVLTGSGDNAGHLWGRATGKEIRQFKGHSGFVTTAAFSPDSRFVLTGSTDNTTRIWDTSTGQELCRTYSLSDDMWIALDQDGRFDTNDMEGIRYLRWMMPDDPSRLLPLEIFARDYYEPRLLPRILNGEKFKPIRDVSGLNRLQAPVKIVSVDRQGQSDLVTVTVEVAKAKSEHQRDRQGNLRETDVFDLRLFRYGQIIGQFPRETDKPVNLATSDRFTHVQEIADWRKSHRVELDADGKRRIKFENIRLPRSTDVKQVEFSAYAFNEDRIKSTTDEKIFDMPQDLTPIKGRAYIITVGVNAYETSLFNLRFAANDARQIQKTLSEKLSQNIEYQEVVQIPLISDYEMKEGQQIVTEKAATKRNIKTVFDLLSGKQLDKELLKDIPNADKIQQARPEDLVLIFFSGNGYADNQGIFYIIPYDTGAQTTGALLAHSISSEELTFWLRDIDAGNMVMIVDMNQSAALIEGQGFKPGPMGNRGFGQLAYDKGMKILTATKSPKNIALEADKIRSGLLTYTLIHDGIENGQAQSNDQRITMKKWLEYAEERVPVLYQEIGGSGSDIAQPALFNFTKKKRDVVLVEKK